jgi:hypothetical protein
MASKVTAWGLGIVVDGETITIDGLPGVKGSLSATKGGYAYQTIDGESHAGNDPQWDTRTALRYALLSYRNQLNAAIVAAAYPRQRAQTQRQSRIAELERLQSETNAMLAQLLAQLNKGK